MLMYCTSFRALVCFWHLFMIMMHVAKWSWFECSSFFSLQRIAGKSGKWRGLRHPTSGDTHLVMWCHPGLGFHNICMRNHRCILWHCLCHGIDLCLSTPMCVISFWLPAKVIGRCIWWWWCRMNQNGLIHSDVPTPYSVSSKIDNNIFTLTNLSNRTGGSGVAWFATIRVILCKIRLLQPIIWRLLEVGVGRIMRPLHRLLFLHLQGMCLF